MGTFRGLRGFDQFAKAVVEHLEVLEAAELERIVEGPKVVLVSRGRWRVRSNRRELRVRSITIFSIEAGRIVGYHVHTDTAAFVQAMYGADERPPEQSAEKSPELSAEKARGQSPGRPNS